MGKAILEALRKTELYSSTSTYSESFGIQSTPGGKPVFSGKSSLDCFTFGMVQPGRSFSSSSYRYGFNGQETDPELKGEGNSVSFSFRNYDPRLGRMWSVDPLSPDYPFWTPYAFAGNMPIWAGDSEGLQPKFDNRQDRRLKPVLEAETPAEREVALANKRAEEKAEAYGVLFGGAVMLTRGAILHYGWRAVLGFAVEEAAEAAFESLTGIPVIIDPIDVLEKGVKKGLLEGGWDGLESWERKRAAEYIEDGSQLKRIDETPDGPKTADWVIDGKNTEFKALTGDTFNQTTALGHLQKATKKDGVQVIDLDIRTPGGTKSDASSLYERFKGTSEGKSFTGDVRIATGDGLVTFPGSN